MNEQELIQGCINQDRTSWDKFVDSYSKLIYSTLHRMFREKGSKVDQDIIEELFNEVFVVLLKDDAKKLRQFKGGCSFASWIRLITTNISIDYLRRLKPATVSLDDDHDEESSLKDVIVDEKSLDIKEALSSKEEKEIFSGVFEKLDVKDQLLLRLLFIDEVSPEEASEIMGLTKEAIYMRKSRLVNELKRLIGDKFSVRKDETDRQL